MSTLRELKRRIKSITSTQQMTQAMKMVSVSKYNRSLSRLEAYRPYQAQCQHLLSVLGGMKLDADSQETAALVYYVALTGNRGLCGNYNQEVLRKLQEVLDAETRPYQVIVCGKWGAENLGAIPHQTRLLSDIPTWEESNALAGELVELYRSGKACEIHFVYQQFKNILTQIPACTQFLPQQQEGTAVSSDYLFEPDRQALEQALTIRCLYAQVYEILLSAATGVHGAMMMSMRTASDNSAEMIEKLSLTMNRMRQSSVTTQVLEIASSSLQEDEGS